MTCPAIAVGLTFPSPPWPAAGDRARTTMTGNCSKEDRAPLSLALFLN